MTRPARQQPASESAGRPLEAARPPEGVTTPVAVLCELIAILLGLRQALESRQSDKRPRIEPMALRLGEVARALGVARRVIERERSAGRFPKPDLTVGKMPLWRPETIRAWLDNGGGR